jgi:hypothetical protein
MSKSKTTLVVLRGTRRNNAVTFLKSVSQRLAKDPLSLTKNVCISL